MNGGHLTAMYMYMSTYTTIFHSLIWGMIKKVSTSGKQTQCPLPVPRAVIYSLCKVELP